MNSKTMKLEASMSMDLLSRLPVDIVLRHVLARLDYVSWVRAGAVSHSWNSLAGQCPPPLGDNIPWIWLSDGKPYPNAGRAPYPLIVTHAHGRGVGPHHVDYRLVLFLLNHPGTDIDKVLFLISTRTINCFLLPISPTDQFSAATLFWPDQTTRNHNPDRPTSWAAAAVAKYDATASDYHRNTALKDLIFHKGELYCISYERKMVAFDVSQTSSQPPTPRVVVAAKKNVKPCYLSSSTTTYFLVESLSGELLLVVLLVERNGSKKNPNFSVHRVDKEKGKLVQVLDLGEEMLFVGGGCSRSILYGSRARNFPFFTPNCIYFFQLRRRGRSISDFDRHLLGKFSMKNNDVVYHEDELLNSMIKPIWIPSNSGAIHDEKI